MAVKIAIVGRGFMGSMHIGAYANLSGVQVAAVCDKRKDTLKPNVSNLALGAGQPDLSRTKRHR